MSKTFDLSKLNLSVGTHSITVKARASGYRDSIKSNEDIYYVYAGESEILQPPTISEHGGSGIDVVDNPQNGDETIGYAVYTENGEYVCFRVKTGQSMHIKHGEGMVGGKYVYVRAIDKNAKASKKSNVAQSGECFVAGTPISMADGTYKMIEEVQVGDEVKSYNFKTSTYCNGTVTKVATGYTTRIAMVLFEDGNYVAMAEGHPLYTQDGWHSITNKNGYPTLVIGDKVLGKSKYVAIQDIQVVDTEPTTVYSLGVTVSNGEDMFDGTYFAGVSMTLATHGGGSA